MSYRVYCCSVFSVLAGLIGCTTPSSTSSTSGTPAGRAVPIDQQAFVVVPATNQLNPAWLNTPTNFFKLGPGDMIEIELLGEPQSRMQALVGPDGKIYYDLLPGLFVWGLTLPEAKNRLEEELQRFLQQRPQVVVTLRQANSQRVWIMGSVKIPGVYGLATPLTLLEALALAGGADEAEGQGSQDTDLDGSFVMRAGKPLPIDFDRLLHRGDLSQNIYLEPDDFVYLRPGGSKGVYVFGAVRVSAFVPFTDKMTLSAAIISVGGTVPYARRREVAIVRGSLSQPTITIADYDAIRTGKAPDLLLEPDDIVYVSFVSYRALAEFGLDIIRQFVSTVALNEGIRSVREGADPVGISVGSGGVILP